MSFSDVFQQITQADRARQNQLAPLTRSDARFRGNDDLQAFEVLAPNELEAGRRRFRPQERAALGAADQVGLEDRVAEAQGRAGAAADVAEGIFERQTRGRGLTGRQQTAARRSLSLSRRLAQAGAGSAERRTSSGLARTAAEAAGGIEDQIFAQEVAGLSNLANAEGQRQIAKANEKANKDANRNSIIGTVGGAALAFLSSEELKDKQGDPGRLLDKLQKVRVEKWNYKGDAEAHIGPFAEEFNDTFGVGQDNRHMISLVDAVGVLFGGLKELNQKVEASG